MLCRHYLSCSGYKNYSYGQSDLTIDLANSPEILAKFIKATGTRKWKNKIGNFFASIELFFRSPDPLDLNKIQKFLLKITVLALIFCDWVGTLPNPVFLVRLLRGFSFPQQANSQVHHAPLALHAVLPAEHIQCHIPALLRTHISTQIVTVRSFFIRNITRYNMQVVINSVLWPFLLTVYLSYEYRGYDWLILMMLVCQVMFKLSQNYILCSLEGERVVVNLATANRLK